MHIDMDAARQFWNARYAQGLVYGTEPTSVAPHIADIFHTARVRSLLEAGCGSGRDALFYAREGFQVTGIDLSDEAIAQARAWAVREGLVLSFIAGDLLIADLQIGAFDAVAAVHVIHLHTEQHRSAIIDRIWHATKLGGLVACANYSTEEAGFSTWQMGPERNTRIDPRGKLVHFFDEQEIRNLFSPTRFDLLKCEQVELAEKPDSGSVVHREWLVIAQKINLSG